MKKFFKVMGALAAFVVLVVIGFVVWVQAKGIPKYAIPQPAVPVTPVAATPDMLAQGEKLVLMDCYGCHVNKQTKALSGHLLTDTPKEFGALYSSNITQDKEYGIGAWTDAEIVTLLRTGIGRDGRYRIIMPQFAHMSDADMSSILAFLRSDHQWVQPDPTPTHEQEPSLLAKVLVNTVMKPLPQPTGAVTAPPASDAVAYGRYLVTGRYVCYDCHSKDFKTNNPLEPEKSEGYMGGGNHLVNEQGQVVLSRNVTPDPETGIGDWTAAQFTNALKYGMSPNGPLHEPMPKYSVLTDEETSAIFAYLQTIPKIKNATTEDGGAVAAN